MLFCLVAVLKRWVMTPQYQETIIGAESVACSKKSRLSNTPGMFRKLHSNLV
jgi:hypothetical protein